MVNRVERCQKAQLITESRCLRQKSWTANLDVVEASEGAWVNNTNRWEKCRLDQRRRDTSALAVVLMMPTFAQPMPGSCAWGWGVEQVIGAHLGYWINECIDTLNMMTLQPRPRLPKLQNVPVCSDMPTTSQACLHWWHHSWHRPFHFGFNFWTILQHRSGNRNCNAQRLWLWTSLSVPGSWHIPHWHGFLNCLYYCQFLSISDKLVNIKHIKLFVYEFC